MALLSGWFKGKYGREEKTAIALGGGGVRGVAHLGVMKVLEQIQDHHFDFLAGTSAGAVFGSLYLLSGNADEAIQRVSRTLNELDRKKSLIHITHKKSKFLANLREKLILAKSLFSLSVIDASYLEEFLVALIGEDATFERLSKPLYVVSTDLVTGKDMVFTKGKLIPALMASSAIPGAFPPQKYKEHLLIDGGSTQKLPTRMARILGARRVLAVDVGSPFQKRADFSNSAQVVSRSEAIAKAMLNSQNRLAADLVLTPQFRDMKWYDFQRHPEALRAGLDEAMKHRTEIERFFSGRRISGRESDSQSRDFLIME